MYENILLAIFLYYPEPIFLSQFLCGMTYRSRRWTVDNCDQADTVRFDSHLQL